MNVSPGITFIGRAEPEKTFALHMEITYEFELGPIHLGPVLEYATSGHGTTFAEDYTLPVPSKLSPGTDLLVLLP